jgi:hypothetical protein
MVGAPEGLKTRPDWTSNCYALFWKVNSIIQMKQTTCNFIYNWSLENDNVKKENVIRWKECTNKKLWWLHLYFPIIFIGSNLHGGGKYDMSPALSASHMENKLGFDIDILFGCQCGEDMLIKSKKNVDNNGNDNNEKETKWTPVSFK